MNIRLKKRKVENPIIAAVISCFILTLPLIYMGAFDSFGSLAIFSLVVFLGMGNITYQINIWNKLKMG